MGLVLKRKKKSLSGGPKPHIPLSPSSQCRVKNKVSTSRNGQTTARSGKRPKKSRDPWRLNDKTPASTKEVEEGFGRSEGSLGHR